MNRYYLFPICLILIAVVFSDAQKGDPWAPVTLVHPLGTDEFGRDLLAVASCSIILSCLKGILLSFLAIFSGTIIAYFTVHSKFRLLSGIANFAALTIEGVPLMLWIMVMTLVIPVHSVVLIFAFTVGTLPFVSRIIGSEIERLNAEHYVEASRICGASELQCLAKHIFPNAFPVLAPLFIQLSGGGVAADGLFSLIGLGNRSQLDIGTLLLRGKENIVLHPGLMAIALITIGVIFLYFWCLYLRLGTGRILDKVQL